MSAVRHPVFVRVFDRMSEREERLGQAAHRQATLDRVSGRKLFGGGCHPNRDTGSAIEAAGFSIESCQAVMFSPCFICAPAARRIIGRARRQGASAMRP